MHWFNVVAHSEFTKLLSVEHAGGAQERRTRTIRVTTRSALQDMTALKSATVKSRLI